MKTWGEKRLRAEQDSLSPTARDGQESLPITATALIFIVIATCPKTAKVSREKIKRWGEKRLRAGQDSLSLTARDGQESLPVTATALICTSANKCIKGKDEEVDRKEAAGWARLTQPDRSRRTRIVTSHRHGTNLYVRAQMVRTHKHTQNGRRKVGQPNQSGAAVGFI
ncbi:hypothetical protein PoB_003926500 [Plakobranchus ocellatus]|uniref:Uncharacterized protein n=1 Tax=Plakobranchus ocellatus TaxID=259542 RepID=A0AAV4AWK3_9GAST|nr:hypothetical protein PoB_003926500 [Plakobranchus ocellatus]